MIIATVNVNGVRAAVTKRSETNLGFLDWLTQTPADVVCLQEVRADQTQATQALQPAIDAGWVVHVASSKIKGRSGVAVLSRQNHKIKQIVQDFPVTIDGAQEFVDSGRYLEIQFDDYRVASIYIPSGEENTPRQDEKHRFLDVMTEYLKQNIDKPLIICGDWNIAHTELDLKNPTANRKKSGFTPEEKAWMDQVVDSGWTDVARLLQPGVQGPYTWWSFRGKAFDNDSGWRIDYHFTPKLIAEKAKRTWIDRASTYDNRWSDHAPLLVEYDL